MKYTRSLFSGIALLLLTTSFTFAQSSSTLNDGDTTSDCITFQTSVLRFGSRDASTGGDVTVLQDFLITKGLLYGQTTGYYGRGTVTAVKKYQKQVGVSATGNVGALTKSFITKETCGTHDSSDDTTSVSPASSVTSVFVPSTQTTTFPAQTTTSQSPTITGFGNKDPNPTTGATVFIWSTSKPANVNLEMVCTPGTINFITDKGNHPGCEKGGVWSWQNQSADSIVVTPVGNTSPVTVQFYLYTVNQNGLPDQKQSLFVTFPAQASPIKSPSITGLSISSDEMGESLYVTGNNLSKTSLLCYEVRVDGEHCQRGFNAQTNNQIIVRLTQNMSTVSYEINVKVVDEKNNLTSNSVSIVRSPASSQSPRSLNVLYPTSGMTTTQGQPVTISWQAVSPNANYVIGESVASKSSIGTFSASQAHCNASDKCYISWTPAISSSAIQVYVYDTISGVYGSSGIFSITAPLTITNTGLVLGASTACASLTRNLHRGDESSVTTQLQSFLYDKGFLKESSTGFYGDKTVEAVKAYQSSRGISPSGMVYEVTRAMIKRDSCGE